MKRSILLIVFLNINLYTLRHTFSTGELQSDTESEFLYTLTYKTSSETQTQWWVGLKWAV